MADNLSAHQLLVQLKHGNINALTVLFARYARQFYGRARNRGLTHEEAEDIVQTVFVYKIFAKIDTYNEPHGAGAGWMWTLCENTITDEIRKKLNHPIGSIGDLPEDILDANPGLWGKSTEYYVAHNCALKSISQADRDLLNQIKEGEKIKRGVRSDEWKAAQKRLLAKLEECLKYHTHQLEE